MIAYKNFNWIQRLIFGIIIWAGFLSTTTLINGQYYGWTDSLWPIYAGTLFLTFVLADIHSYQHAILIEKKKKDINHAFSFFMRCLVAIVICLPVHHKDIMTLKLAAVSGAWFWIVFDMLLNKRRDRELFYVTNYYRAAWLDKLMRKWFSTGSKPEGHVMLAVKIIVLVGLSVVYFIGGK